MCDYSVSVVIPNYNNAKYLEECIRSVIRQKYPILEVIVVDDKSSDDSIVVLKKLEKNSKVEIKIIELSENRGVSYARNTGLKAARGEYITFLDSDDCWADDNKLENEMKLVKEWYKKGKDIAAFSKIVYMNEKGERINTDQKRKVYTGNIFTPLLLAAETKIIPRDYCVRTTMLREIGGYREDMNLYEDYELTLRLSKIIEFWDTGKAGTVYRIKKNGLSDQRKRVSDKVFWSIFCENIKGMSFKRKVKCFILKIGRLMMKSAKEIVYNIVVRKKENEFAKK